MLPIRLPIRLLGAIIRYDHGGYLPVLMKEMRSRMRGMRAPVLLFIATAITIIYGLVIVMPMWNFFSDTMHATQRMSLIGRSLFCGLITLEAVICGLIAPALTAGTISLEREQQTLDMLLLTRMSSTNIVMGKLLSALSFVFMVLFCTLPVMAISFLLGGVDPGQVLWSLVLIISMVALFGAIGIFASAYRQQTTGAVVVAYGLCLVGLGLIPAFMGIQYLLLDNFGPSSPEPRLLLVVIPSLFLSIVPTTFISTVLSTAIRRPIPRWGNVLLWLALSITWSMLMLAYPDDFIKIFQAHPEYLALGNPVAALVVLSGRGIFLGSIPAWVMGLVVPWTVVILLVGAWMFTAMAVGHVERVRHAK